ncbi:MAG: CAP domain-containing protein [Mucilaginibacter sp.]|uniref:CAP domain-containing protein n=1 Tax=Mucilaginibacter sp. TaxID=1882438 RepID=UPI003266D0B8
MKRLSFTLLIYLSLLPVAMAQSSLHISKQDFRGQFLNAINAKRAKGCNCGNIYMKPAQPLTWNDKLALAAKEHAEDMYAQNYFSHDSKDGRKMENRMLDVGYTYKGFRKYAIGENIAFNQRSIDEVLTGWFKSNAHCKNLMNPDFTEIGIAEYKYYWVQDFGGRVSFAFRK